MVCTHREAGVIASMAATLAAEAATAAVEANESLPHIEHCYERGLASIAGPDCFERTSYVDHSANGLQHLVQVSLYVVHAPWLRTRRQRMEVQLKEMNARDVTWVVCVNRDDVRNFTVWQRRCVHPCFRVTRYQPHMDPENASSPATDISNGTLSLVLKHRLAMWDMLRRSLPAALLLEDDAQFPPVTPPYGSSLWDKLALYKLPPDAGIFFVGSYAATRTAVGTLGHPPHQLVEGTPRTAPLWRRNMSAFPMAIGSTAYMLLPRGARRLRYPPTVQADLAVSLFPDKYGSRAPGVCLDATPLPPGVTEHGVCKFRGCAHLRVPQPQYSPPRWVIHPSNQDAGQTYSTRS